MRFSLGVFKLVCSHIPSLTQHLPIHLHPEPCDSRPPQTGPQTHLSQKQCARQAIASRAACAQVKSTHDTTVVHIRPTYETQLIVAAPQVTQKSDHLIGG